MKKIVFFLFLLVSLFFLYGQDGLMGDIQTQQQMLMTEENKFTDEVGPNEEVDLVPMVIPEGNREEKMGSGEGFNYPSSDNFIDNTSPQETPFDYSVELMLVDKTYDLKIAQQKLELFLSLKKERLKKGQFGKTYNQILEIINLWKKKIAKLKALRGY